MEKKWWVMVWSTDFKKTDHGPFDSYELAAAAGRALNVPVFWTGYGADSAYFDLQWHTEQKSWRIEGEGD